MHSRLRALAALALPLALGCAADSAATLDGSGIAADDPTEEEIYELIGTSGAPQYVSDSELCPRSYGNQALTSQLGDLEADDNYFCVEPIALPPEIADAVAAMEAEQFENYSDYDRRVTKVFAYNSEYVASDFVSMDDIETLTRAFDIDPVFQDEMFFAVRRGGDDLALDFEGLFAGSEHREEPDVVADYLGELTDGMPLFEVSMGSGLDLYPGGGVYTTFHFYFGDAFILVVKEVWWDA